MGTLIVGGILAIIVVLVIRKMVLDRKNGKSACGCSCEGCSGNCHSK